MFKRQYQQQISRDRKKKEIKGLQDKNNLLNEQYEKIKNQNQRLKAQLKFDSSSKSISTQPYKNIFIKLLITLGIICLFAIVKIFFLPQSKKIEQKLQIKSYEQQYMFQSSEQVTLDFTKDEKNTVSSKIELQLADSLQSRTLISLIRDKIKKTEINSHNILGSLLTSRGQQEIRIAKEIALSL